MWKLRRITKELLRRRVIPVAVFYAGIAWLIIQVGDVARETWDIDETILRYLWIALGFGFPVALVLSWIYDITPRGIIATGTDPGTPTDDDKAQAVEPTDPNAILCPNCRVSNRAGARFCIQCGTALERVCPSCGVALSSNVVTCPACGHESETQGTTLATANGTDPKEADDSAPERVYACVLCASLSPFDVECEGVDEDEEGEIIANYVAGFASIVEQEGGRFEGCFDNVITSVFGVPFAREHDAVCAVRAALRVRDLKAEDREGRAPRTPVNLSGIGIAAGFTVTSRLKSAGFLGAGHAIRDASRLSATASHGEVLVSPDVFSQVRNYFEFAEAREVTIGKAAEPFKARPVLSSKEDISTVHRTTGRRSPLIGRRREIRQLEAAVDCLRKGRSSVVTIVGQAGTGKSRLIEEIKLHLPLSELQYFEGHAFSYTKSVPYFPIRDLLRKVWGVTDNEVRAVACARVERALRGLLGEGSSMIPYILGLMGLSEGHPSKDDPEVWDTRVKRSLLALLSAISIRRRTIFFIEDMHWADSASLGLVRFLVAEMRCPAMLVCTSRLPLELSRSGTGAPSRKASQFIHLHDLSPSEAAEMTDHLLDRKPVPEGFLDFVTREGEGNPFYVEELVNSVIEAGLLKPEDEGWRLKGSLSDINIPPTIHGVLNDRINRLAPRVRRVMQEAAVIGRVFSTRLLAAVTSLPDALEECIETLEQAGLIQAHRGPGGTEYVFNHVMTQEVVYHALLRRQRREIHEKVGRAAEKLYGDNLAESCEMLALHFKNGNSRDKAVRYLMEAAKRSWHRYSLEEASNYYQDAYSLLTGPEDPSEEDSRLLLHLIDQWAIVYNHEGDYKALGKLLKAHEPMARAMETAHLELTAMFFGWQGYTLQCAENLDESYDVLEHALTLAERSESDKARAYVHAWMARTCTDMGRFEEAIASGCKARAIADQLERDPKLLRFTLSALGLAYYFSGDRKSSREVADFLKHYAEQNSDLRALLLGHINRGCSYLIAGEYPDAIAEFERGAGVAVDPMYGMYARLMHGVALASAGRLSEAEGILSEVVEFDRTHGFDLLGSTAKGMMSIVRLSRGELSDGISLAEEVLANYRDHGNWFRYAHQHHMLGTVYLKLALREGPASLGYLAKNAAFLIKNIRHAWKRAEMHFRDAADTASSIGALGVLGQTYLDLGRLQSASGNLSEARNFFLRAREIFDASESTGFLQRVDEELAALEEMSELSAAG